MRLRCWGVAACLLASGASVLWYYPHTLAYFNELAGGPLGGPRHLSLSNFGAGQDARFLLRWLAEHPEARPFYTYLLRFGLPQEPWAAGVHEMPQGKLPEGWYAVNPSDLFEERPFYPQLKDAQLVGRAGYSIYIYRLGPGAARGN